MLAQINSLKSARETLTGQLASQAQEARSARLELETRLEKAELEKTQVLEKLKSLEAEVGVLKGAGSPEQVGSGLSSGLSRVKFWVL
jgi:chromosome segregation ATPase